MKTYNTYLVSCETATFLIEKKLDSGLTSKQKVQLFVHEMICSVCRKYEKQSRMLDQLLRKKIGQTGVPPTGFNPDTAALNKFKILIYNKLDEK